MCVCVSVCLCECECACDRERKRQGGRERERGGGGGEHGKAFLDVHGAAFLTEFGEHVNSINVLSYYLNLK